MKTTKQLVKFDFDIAVITALDAKYKDIQITDTTSYALVMAGLAEYRELRLAIDDKHKELKRDILEAGRGLDGDKNRLKALLEPGENHLKEIRQIEDDKKAKIKEEKEAKEKERIEAIQEKINRILNTQAILLNQTTSSIIEQRLVILRGMQISKEIYMEFTNQALEAQKTAATSLEELLTQRLQFEKEEVERKAEAEHLELQREKQAEAQAKIDEAEQAAAKRQAENDARMAAEQAKIDEKIRKVELRQHEVEEKERKAEVQKAQQEFERQATIKAEQEAKEKGARAEQEKIDKEEAEAKEKARQEALKPDKEKLIKFADELYNTEIPLVKATEAQKILAEARGRLSEVAADIKMQANKL